MITIDVSYSINGVEKHFCTIVDDVKDVHQALMDCIKFIDTHSARYVDHTIVVRKKVEEGAEYENSD